MKTLLFLLTVSVLAAPSFSEQDHIIGAWILDHELTKKLAKTEILPLPEYQTDYFAYTDDGSIINWSTKKKTKDAKEDYCHFYMHLNGKVSGEYCVSLGTKVIDKIITKKINASLYRLADGNPNGTKWTGSFEVSPNGEQLTIEFKEPGAKATYLKVFQRMNEKNNVKTVPAK